MKKNRKSLPQNEAKIRHFAGLSFHTPGSRYEREKEPYIYRTDTGLFVINNTYL